MSSVMYTGGSDEGPICDFTSDQIRESCENKRSGGDGMRSHDFLLISSFPRHSQEKTLYIIWAAWGVTALPQPPFWKHPLERSHRRVHQRAIGIEIKRNADETTWDLWSLHFWVGLMKSSSLSLLGFGVGEGEVRWWILNRDANFLWRQLIKSAESIQAG